VSGNETVSGWKSLIGKVGRALGRALGGTIRSIIAAGAVVAAVFGIVHYWSEINSEPNVVVNIREAKVETQISLEQYEHEENPPTSSAGTADTGLRTWVAAYRLAADTAPALARPDVLLAAVAGTQEAAQLKEGEMIKKEGTRITEEAKHQEEAEQQEEAKIEEEAARAEDRAQAEQKKEAEDAKLAEKAERQGVAKAQAEEEKARQEAARANSTAHAKKEEARQAPAKRRMEAGASQGAVEAVLSKSGLGMSSSTCASSCALRPTVEKAIASSRNLAQAAKEVAAAVGGSRNSDGARVDYTVSLDGLANKVLFLTWTLCSRNSGALSKEYWRNVIFKKYEPSSDTKQLVGTFWAPIPSAKDDYYIRLRVFDGRSEVAHTSTEVFSDR
jgi:hypothetical protein